MVAHDYREYREYRTGSGARDGRSYVVSVLAENPRAPLSQARATLTLISAVKGAFELAAP